MSKPLPPFGRAVDEARAQALPSTSSGSARRSSGCSPSLRTLGRSWCSSTGALALRAGPPAGGDLIIDVPEVSLDAAGHERARHFFGPRTRDGSGAAEIGVAYQWPEDSLERALDVVLVGLIHVLGLDADVEVERGAVG